MATTKLFTADDLLVMPESEPSYELVRGELREMPGTSFLHTRSGKRLGTRLDLYVDDHGLGAVVGADAGFLLFRDPDTVRVPDVAFIRADRVPTEAGVLRFIEGAPDLAVEILSPSNTRQEMDEKVAMYLEAGSRLVWVVDALRRGAVVHAPGRAPITLGPDGVLDGEDVVPGFRLPLAELFP